MDGLNFVKTAKVVGEGKVIWIPTISLAYYLDVVLLSQQIRCSGHSASGRKRFDLSPPFGLSSIFLTINTLDCASKTLETTQFLTFV